MKSGLKPRQNYQMEALVLRGNASVDDRMKIQAKIREHPFNCLSFLEARDIHEGWRTYGTVFAIHQRYGLTAGHNLLRFNEFSEATPYDQIQVYPAADGQIMATDNKSDTKIRISEFRVCKKFPKAFGNREQSGSDYALVKFSTPLKIKQYCKITKIDASNLKGGNISITGYPYQKTSKGSQGGLIVQAYLGTGKVAEVSPATNILEYMVNTTRGQSGSPIFYDDIDSRSKAVIGIHNACDRQKMVNSGVLFTDAVLFQINSWIWQLQTPLFRMSSFRSGTLVQRDLSDYLVYRNSKIKQSNYGSSIRQTLNVEEIFRFNWDVGYRQRDDFDIRGSRIVKRNLNKSQSLIFSFEAFPKKRVSYCNIAFKECRSLIYIGVATTQGKQAAKNTKNTSPVFTDFTNPKGKSMDQAIKEQSKIPVFKQSGHPFDPLSYQIRVKVDYLKQQISILRSQEKLIEWQIPNKYLPSELHLCVGLSAFKDRVQVIKYE